MTLPQISNNSGPQLGSVISPAVELPGRATSNPATLSKPRRIVVVDSDLSPRQSVQWIFEPQCEVIAAARVSEIIHLVERHLIDVLLIELPKGLQSGLQIITRLKELDASLEIIVMGSRNTDLDLQRLLSFGVCDILPKPFSVASIQAAVARAMQKKSMLHELQDRLQESHFLREKVVEFAQNQQSIKAECEIYACILHDLRNPISIISNLANRMEDQVVGKPFLHSHEIQDLNRQLQQLRSQVQRCTQVADRYLSFMHRRNDSSPVTWINKLLADLQKLLQLSPSAALTDLRFNFLPSDLAVSMDATDLLQVLINLATNAMECTKDRHSVSIHAAHIPSNSASSHLKLPAEDHLWIRSETFKEGLPSVAVSIADDGPGISSSDLRKIFQPYFSTKSRDQGIGLGLAIVNRLLSASSAALLVRSTPGLGTSFTLFVNEQTNPR